MKDFSIEMPSPNINNLVLSENEVYNFNITYYNQKHSHS